MKKTNPYGNTLELQVSNASLETVATTMSNLLSFLDTTEPGARAAALCAAFLAVCTQFKSDPREIMGMTKRMVNLAPRYGVTEFEALRLYLENEEI